MREREAVPRAFGSPAAHGTLEKGKVGGALFPADPWRNPEGRRCDGRSIVSKEVVTQKGTHNGRPTASQSAVSLQSTALFDIFTAKEIMNKIRAL